MAKKPAKKKAAPKGKKKPAPVAAAPKAEPVIKMTFPNEAEIVGAVERLAKLKKSAQSASGMIGEHVESLVSKKNFDKKALGIVRGLAAMPEERFAITWSHILRYAKALKFEEMANQEPTMFEEEIPEQADIEQAIAKAPDNDPKIRQLRPAREVAPTTGEETQQPQSLPEASATIQ